MQLQPARWDKSQLPASDDDDGPVQPRSRPSSPSERSDRSSASPRSLPPRMRLKENKSPFEFRVIKQASATPSQSSSTASTDRELVPIPSPPWAKNKPLPSEDQPAEGPAEESNLSSNHYIPKASSNRYYRQLPSPSSSSLPPFRSLDTRSPPPEGSFPPTASTSRRHSPPLSPRHPYRASQLETAPSASTSSSKPYHPYYRSQSFDYPPPPPQPMRHRSYHHLPSLSSPSPSTGQKRRYASGDEDSQVRGRRMDVDTNNREPGMNIDKRRKEDLEREKALRTLPPLPPFRRGQQGGHRLVSYPSHSPPSSAPPPLGQSRNEHYYANPLRDTPAPPPPPPRSYSEYTSPSYPQPEYLPLASGPYPPPPSTHSNILPPPANYPAPYRPPPPEQQPHFPYPPSYPPYPPPRAYGLPPPPPQPPQQAPSRLQPPPPKKHPPFPPNRNGISKAKANAPPPPPPPPHSQLLPSSTPYSYFHKIRLNRPKQSRSSTAASSSQHQPPPQAQEMQDDQTLYQQAAAARHAAYSSPDTVDSTTLTTYPVPYSIGVKAASSTAGMAGDAGRLVGEYEQHPLRQQTSYLPISAVGGAQFVLKPPRIRKTKSSKLKFMVSGSSATPTFPLTPASQFSEVIQTNGADVGDNFIESVVEPRPFRPNPEDVLIEIKQEEENVAASVAAITIAESHEPLVAPDGEDELATPAFDDGIAKEFNDNDMGGSTVVLSLGSPTDFMNSETNTFAAPARPSRTVKKYPCDICGQIFTRSGDVKRHKESRHRESAGCICPYCGRILTRQDALQRHWDKYCRKKNKRMDRRRRFGLSFDPGIDVDPGLLHPAPRHEGNQASLGGSNGIDIRSFRTNRSKTFGRGRRNNGKQKARTHRDGDGDVRMLSGSESESEVDELESEDPLDGYDSEEEEKRRDRGNLQGAGKDKDKEIDELNESEDNEREDGVKSDAEGVSVNGDDFYTISGESEDESEEEGGMDARPDAEPIMEGLTRSPLEVVEEPEPFSHTAFKRPILESPKQGLAPDPKILPQSPPAKDEAVKSPTPMNTSPHLSNFRQASSLSFVEFRPPPPSSTVQSVPSKPRSAPAAPTNSGPAPMSAFTSTFPAQPPHLRQPRARAEYRVRYNAPMLPPQQPTLSPPRHGLPVVRSDSLSVQVHVPPSNLSARIRRGPKPRRTDFDAVLDPSQTAAQGGQIRMRVLPQATHTPPVQPALAIMHEQPHVTKRKGKRVDGLVPEYGFVPREYVYRERE